MDYQTSGLQVIPRHVRYEVAASLVVVVGALLLTACGGANDSKSDAKALPASSSSPTPSHFAVTGIFALTDSDGWIGLNLDNLLDPEDGDECAGTGGYDDISEGTGVTVKDGSGNVIATSRLGRGEVTSILCVFEFTVQVPASEFYAFEVSHRGEITYSREELQSRGWRVEFSLG